MSEAEKVQRQAALYKVVTTHTSHTWAAILVKMLLGQLGTENTAHQTPFMDQEKLNSAYHSAKKRLLLFDYDVRGPLSIPLTTLGVWALRVTRDFLWIDALSRGHSPPSYAYRARRFLRRQLSKRSRNFRRIRRTSFSSSPGVMAGSSNSTSAIWTRSASRLNTGALFVSLGARPGATSPKLSI